jgi:hypothetical protein
MATIDNKTKIPLFTVFGALIPIMGGVLWLSVIYSKVEAHTESIVEFKTKQETEMQLLQEIKERVIRIEENIKNKGDK